MAAMVHNALYANQVFASDAVVPHELFDVDLAEVTPFKKLLLLYRIVKGNKIFGQIFCFEVLLEGGPTYRTAGQLLFLDFQEAFFAKSVSTVQIARDSLVAVEVLNARGALH